MSSMRDCTNIWHEKSSELRKFWNCTMKAVCSSSDFRAKLMEDASSIARSSAFFMTTTPSRTAETGTNSCVERLFERGVALLRLDKGICYDQFELDSCR